MFSCALMTLRYFRKKENESLRSNFGGAKALSNYTGRWFRCSCEEKIQKSTQRHKYYLFCLEVSQWKEIG